MAEADNLKKLIEKIAKEQKYTLSRIAIEPITSDPGANFTANLYRVTVSEPLKPDLNLFAKVANLNEEIRTKNEKMSRVYLVETVFYTELAVNFERIYEKHNVPAEHRLMMPKYFGHDLVKLGEILLIQDLEEKGFKSFDRMKSFNWEYASAAVQQIARFHALGLSLRDENPTEFQRIADHFSVNIIGDNDSMHQMMEQAIKNGSEAALGTEYGERLQRYFATNEVMAKMMQLSLNDKTMLIHGDFKPSNLMHRRRNGKLEIIPLDYQMLRLGSPMYDLMQFIFSGSDEEFRRLHYQRTLDHYHAELTLALQRLQIDVEKVYSKKTFEQDLQDTKPLGLILGLILVAMVTVTPEDIAKPGFAEDFADMVIKPNQLAQERILGIVKDYVRWGVQ